MIAFEKYYFNIPGGYIYVNIDSKINKEYKNIIIFYFLLNKTDFKDESINVYVQYKNGIYNCYSPFYNAEVESHKFERFLDKLNVWIIGLINKILMKRKSNKNWFAIHGSACHYNNKTILIVGQKTSGKTTLLKKFIEKGASYISDDTIYLNDSITKVNPNTLCMRIKNSNEELSNQFFDKVKLDMVYTRPRKICKDITIPYYFIYLDKKHICSPTIISNNNLVQIILKNLKFINMQNNNLANFLSNCSKKLTCIKINAYFDEHVESLIKLLSA